MPKNGLNVSLNSYDDIFSTEEARQEEQREQVQQISIEELRSKTILLRFWTMKLCSIQWKA